MASSIRLVSFLGAIAFLAGLSTSAATPNATIDLFVAELAGPSATNIEASIITVISSLSETQMVISCPDNEESEDALQAPPCRLIHGATVTMNPTGMSLNLHRESIQTNTMNLDTLTWETALTETATVTCNIQGRTSASCTGQVTSTGTITSYPAQSGVGTGNLGLFGVRTISEDIGSSGAHTMAFGGHIIPVTVAAGLQHLPVPTTSTSETSSSTGGAPRATGLGRGQAVVAGALAVVGGVVFI